MRTPAALLPALLLLSACDATATARSDAKIDAAAPTVAVDAAALVDANADVNVDANAAANLDAKADANLDANLDATARTGLLADGKLTVSAEAFKLGTVTTLVQSGTIETAEELELAVNDPESDINTLDVDLDGKIDHVEVIEVRHDADARVDFQMRVIPSSKASIEHSVELASASLVAARATSEVSFSASFSASVGFFAGASAQAEVHSFVTPATFEASAVVVGLPLLSWAFVAERPVYTSVFVEAGTGRWIPPGHLKHGLWKATGADVRGHGNVRGGGVGLGGKVGKVGKGGKFEGHVGAEVHGKAGKSGPVKQASKAGSSSSKHGGVSVGGKVGGKVGGSSGASTSGGKSGGGKSGGGKSGGGKSGGGKGGKGK